MHPRIISCPCALWSEPKRLAFALEGSDEEYLLPMIPWLFPGDQKVSYTRSEHYQGGKQKKTMQENKRRAALADFLRSRRARLTPEQAGLPTGPHRRATGLRREDVAFLAGISVTWYTWLEQGRTITASADLVERLSQALQLSADERDHLFLLAGHPLATDQLTPALQLPLRLQSLLDALDPCPAHIRNHRWDVLAWNKAEVFLVTDWEALPVPERNAARNYLMNPAIQQRQKNWEQGVRETAAHLRMDYARHMNDSAFLELIERLRQNDAFEHWWSDQEVLQERGGPLELRHPLVGQLALERLTVVVEQEPFLTLRVLLPFPGTDGREKLERIIQSNFQAPPKSYPFGRQKQ